MQFETFFTRVSAKTQVTKEQVQAYLSGCSIDAGDEIPDRLVESFESEIIAQYSSAITQTKAPTESSLSTPAKKKSGGLAKSRKGSVVPTEAPQVSDPVYSAETVFEGLQDETKSDLIKFVRDGEELRLGVEGTIDRYIETFPDRLWSGIAERQKARPPRSSEVVKQAKAGWDNVIVELRAEMTEMGIDLKG